MNRKKFNQALRSHIDSKYGTVLKAARAWEMSSSFVHAVLSSKKEPSRKILDDMGFTKQRKVTVTYFPKE